jgi:hypothetical protein
VSQPTRRTLAMQTGLTDFEPSLSLRTRGLEIGDQRLAVDFPQMPPKIQKITEARRHRAKWRMCLLYLYMPEISPLRPDWLAGLGGFEFANVICHFE